MTGRDCALVAFGSSPPAHRSHQRRRRHVARSGRAQGRSRPAGRRADRGSRPEPLGRGPQHHHACASLGGGGGAARRQPGLQHRRHSGGLRAHGGAGPARPDARPHRLGHQPGRQPGRRHHLLGHRGGRLRGHHAGHPGHRDVGRGLPSRIRPHRAGPLRPPAGLDGAASRAFRPRRCSTSTVPTGPGTSSQGARLTTARASASTATRCEYRETRGNRRRYHIYNDDLSYHHEPGTDFEAVAEG